MRILIHPEELRRASAEVSRVAADLEGAASRADNALRRVPWEAREKAQIEQRAGELRKSSARLVQQAHEMGRSLQRTAERFDAADRAGSAGVGAANSGFQTAFQQWMTNPAAAYAALNATPAQQQLALGLMFGLLLGGGRPGGTGSAGGNHNGGAWNWAKDNLKVSGGSPFYSKDFRHPGTPGEYAMRPNIAVTIDGSAKTYGDKAYGSVGGVPTKGESHANIANAAASAGIGMGPKGFQAFAGASASMVTTGAGGRFGSDKLAVTGGTEATLLSGDVQAGYNPKDKSFELGGGVNLASVKAEVGANIAGVNTSVGAEVGLKAELGIKIGKENEVKLPFVTVSFGFGGAK